jgi:hypothetical protein
MIKYKSFFICIIALLVLMYSCQPTEKDTYLFKVVNEKVESDQLNNEPLIWAWEIELFDSLLKTETKAPIKIILEDKQEVNITMNNIDKKTKTLKWHGSIENSSGSIVTFIITPRGTVAGNIRTEKGDLYKLRAIKEGRYLLAKIDITKYKEDIPEIKIEDEPGDTLVDLDPCPNTDPASKIDVMVIYTDDTRAAAGGVDQIESEILLAIEETNRAYINSNVTQRINLVYMAEVNYAETGSVQDDVDALRSKTDGILDNIHTLRDNHSADIVAMIVESLDYAGGAITMETVTTAHEQYAFPVIKRTYAAGNYSFAHELGHIMGCQHDCDNNNETVPYIYAHGHYNTSPTPATVAKWHTVMSYQHSGSGRICYFSNPGITYPPGATDGDVMGTTTGACQADNHQTLNNTALTVANFRCSGSDIENVWMKDTWNDTGQEPDPNTASESMYKSPYIWVRNDQDVNKLYQHQHQNPQHGTGISNWIYVKLHNGGAAMTGNLEVYYANASISLSWPAQWTMINSIPLTVPASSTEIAEIEWPATPGTGHYCLLARWNSTSDPMHAAEGTNIGHNVRQNNNIVWRNVNIEPAVSGDEPTTTKFKFIWGDTLATFIRVSCDEEYPNKAFATHARLTLDFDQNSFSLLQNWTPEDTNIERQEDKFIIKSASVDFTNLPFKKDHNGEITLTFEALKETPKMIYFVDVSQLQKRKDKVIEVGGVSYEINTQLLPGK